MTEVDFRPSRYQTPMLPPSVQELRHEVRAFLRTQLVAGGFDIHVDAGLNGHSPDFTRRVAEMGWIGMTWPKRYGGHGRSALERYVVTEELLAAGAPVAAHWVADRQTGPLLLRYGTEEQKETFLPEMARGEHYFAIGMSEPDAGSDLASIRTLARRTDGGWLVNGRKTWTSHAQTAHSMITLVRTSALDDADRHAGMSQVIVDLRSLGVQIRPIRLLTGEAHFNDVVLDDVFVPDTRVVGRIGDGWHQVISELAYERSGPERFFSTFWLLRELVDELGPAADDTAAAALGRLIARFASIRRMSISVAAALELGESPLVQAALVKDLGTRLENEVIDIARELVATEPSISSSRHFDRLLAESVLSAPGFTIRGGTTEILRGIVARGLGIR